MPTALFTASSMTSESVGCVCTQNASSFKVVPRAIALAHSCTRSAACIPMMCTPRIFSLSLRNRIFAMPSPSPSASAFELARKYAVDLPSSKPSAVARSFAVVSLNPTIAISGCVKHAAGTVLWSTACVRPTMFSTADTPCAEAACASMRMPLASPMQYRFGETTSAPSSPLASTRICLSTGTNPPRLSVTPTASRPRFAVAGERPVATMHASTSSSSTFSPLLASVNSMRTGVLPSSPGVTLVANTFVWKSMGRELIRRRCARRAISVSNPGMMLGMASMKVTFDPSAVYTSENSRPM
mmetsp:Transcript_639/g.1670  ORF Transcript_639/g.1670 Transcript_639/m.1670 type:complete len:299 (-) Transcript_639:816-1712(-)